MLMLVNVRPARFVRRTLTSIACLVLVPCALAATETLDWNNVSWPSTSLSQSYTLGAGNLTLSVSGDTAALVAGTPQIATSPTGGLTNEPVLQFVTNFGPGSSYEVPITLSFSHSGGVSNVSFTLFDIDASANPNDFLDEVSVTATDGFNTFNPSTATASANNTFLPPNTIRGTASASNTSADGNASFVFNQTGITSVTVVFRYAGPAADPSSQVMGLHDITFTAQEGGSSTSTALPTTDPDFDDGTVVGKVFHDRDGDGRQGPGETGIPGVRLATVEGLLIETDGDGRYHVEGLDGGLADRGRNFIVKVDPASLPPGAVFTTANPLVRRITRGMAERFDFGVRLPDAERSCCRITEVKLGEIYFEADSETLWPAFEPYIRELADRLREHGGGVVTVDGLSEGRVRQVVEQLRRALGDRLMGKVEFKRGRAPAGDTPEICDADGCRAAEGYTVEAAIHPRTLPTGPLGPDDRDAATRVDLGGRFLLSMPRGGSIWTTEDAVSLEPRLALLGPEQVPLADGRLAAPATFYLYTNYAAFLERAELLVFRSDDTDRVAPLAMVPVDPATFGAFVWDGEVGQEAIPGDELRYLLRVYDRQGRRDETRVQSLQLVAADGFAPRPTPRLSRHGRDDGEQADQGRPELPLSGQVLVLEPPLPQVSLTPESRTYAVRPGLSNGTLSLGTEDRAKLDGIADEWSGRSNVRIEVRGHTDSRAAARDRNATNQELSVAYARAVADYLRQFGFDDEQISVDGRGSDEPLASNMTEEGRRQNRRVEVRVSGELVSTRTSGPGKVRLIHPDSGLRADVTGNLATAQQRLQRRVERGARDTVDAPTGTPVGRADDAVTAIDALVSIYGADDLAQRSIPIHGSRVRIHGQDVAGDYALSINGLPAPVDAQGRFALEYLMPVGRHEFGLSFADTDGGRIDRPMTVEVTGRSMFFVALADATASGNSPSGNLQPLAGDDRFTDNVFVEGRVAFYLKGKIKGKYLITAQLDSREEEIGDLGDRLDTEDPRRLFRRLDPDRYYPVYGDDSTTISDTDSQGRFYVRLDWNHSEALWGNFHTGLTGNELSQYNRTLYGAKLQHESVARTDLGQARTEADVFVSEAQTSLGHSEFLGTGGSLYYLRHRDIVQGSDKARVEIRERDTERVIENITLVRGLDYEIDELQGRILLARPLAQITRQHQPALIKDTPLDGDDVILLVDYEFVPTGTLLDQTTVGARGRQWLGNHVAVGGTYVDEKRGGQDYQLTGGDLTLQAGPGTYLKAEFSETEATQTNRFVSNNGGLSFDALTAGTTNRTGEAVAIEGRLNLEETFGTRKPWVVAAWWRDLDAGFSVARRETIANTTEYGTELTGRVGERVRLSARANVRELEGIGDDTRASLQGDVRIARRGQIAGEVRYLSNEPMIGDAVDALLGAVRYSHQVHSALNVFATGQFTLDDDDGRYLENDLFGVGIRSRLGDRVGFEVELNDGDRGEATVARLDYQVNEAHRIYGTYTLSTDRVDAPGHVEGTRFALGHRSRLSDQTTVFTENQFTRTTAGAGIGRVFGLDFHPASGWRLGFNLQNGELESGGQIVDRDAWGVSGGYQGQRARWLSRYEYRSDEGTERNRQTLTSNRVDWKVTGGLSLQARLNVADTDDEIANARIARFTETGLGLAFRPVNFNWLNLLAKYTYLYDVASTGQSNPGPDQRSHIYSLAPNFRIGGKWELGAKVAERRGELRPSGSDWFETTVNFAAIRARYHFARQWETLVELRSLDADQEQQTRTGALLEVVWRFAEHYRVGVGYNFTDFSDDLANVNYDNNGWFLNVVNHF